MSKTQVNTTNDEIRTRSELRDDKDLLLPVEFGKIVSNLLDIPTVTDIMIWEGEVIVVDSAKSMYKLDLDKYSQQDRDELIQLLSDLPRRLATRMHLNYNTGNAILDAELPYKDIGLLRVNAVHNILISSDLSAIAIRKSNYALSLNDKNMVKDGFLDENILNLMQLIIGSNCNVLISGVTGSGKTSFLRYLATNIINKRQAVITIEDTLEAYLKKLNPEMIVLAMKANKDYDFSSLLKTSLRQNPDWILVSEARGIEVIDLLNAVGTGHNIISTIHANGAANIPNRLIDMAKVEGAEATRMYKQIHQNIDIGIHIDYTNDEEGSHRRIVDIVEFYTDNSNKACMDYIYRYDYATDTYISNKIKSSRILRNFAKSKLSTEKIKGVFINE